MKDYNKAGKLYLKLTGILYPIYGDNIEFHLGETEETGLYLHIMKKGIGVICEDFIQIDMDKPNIEETTEQVKKMFEPKFVPIRNTCMDLIGKEVWVDKKEKHKVKFIGANGIWLENKNVIEDLDRLWIKE